MDVRLYDAAFRRRETGMVISYLLCGCVCVCVHKNSFILELCTCWGKVGKEYWKFSKIFETVVMTIDSWVSCQTRMFLLVACMVYAVAFFNGFYMLCCGVIIILLENRKDPYPAAALESPSWCIADANIIRASRHIIRVRSSRPQQESRTFLRAGLCGRIYWNAGTFGLSSLYFFFPAIFACVHAHWGESADARVYRERSDKSTRGPI